MSETQTITRADRLAAICAKFAAGARYEIFSLAGTRRRVVVTDPETGDRVGAIGDTLDEAIATLTAKVGAGATA